MFCSPILAGKFTARETVVRKRWGRGEYVVALRHWRTKIRESRFSQAIRQSPVLDLLQYFTEHSSNVCALDAE